MTECRVLREAELAPDLFSHFHRYQEITHCWYKENGQWVVHAAPRIIENWNQSQREFVCQCLREVLSEGGMVAGAFADGSLKGFVCVEGIPIGSRKQYLALPFLHVSRELRGNGIGRTLFAMAKDFAASKGAEKLYLSTQPSIETQAFYKAVGCVEAEEYSEAHVAHNPQECQLECQVQEGRTK